MNIKMNCRIKGKRLFLVELDDLEEEKYQEYF